MFKYFNKEKNIDDAIADSQFDKLPCFETVAIVINIKTHILSTLAVLSVKRHIEIPIVVIDCSNDDSEYNYFERLQKKAFFYLLNLPLQIHGKTIDLVFRKIKAKNILLLDSDAEIIDASFLQNEFYETKNAFGLGFIHEAAPLSKDAMKGYRFIYYQERMWIPCVLLKREKIIEALNIKNITFAAKKTYNDFPLIPIISKLLYFRFFFKFFQKYDLFFFRLFRRKYYDYFKPSMIYYDTGAEVYMYLKYKCGYDFLGLPMKFHEKYVNHFHGISRKILSGRKIEHAGNFAEDDILKKLSEVYGFDYVKFQYNFEQQQNKFSII